MIPTADVATLLDSLTDLEVRDAEGWGSLKKPDRLGIVRRLPDLGATHDGMFSRPVFRFQNRGRAREPQAAETDALALTRAVLALTSMEWNGYWITSFSVTGWPTPLPTSPDESQRSMLESSYMIQVSTELAVT